MQSKNEKRRGAIERMERAIERYQKTMAETGRASLTKKIETLARDISNTRKNLEGRRHVPYNSQ